MAKHTATRIALLALLVVLAAAAAQVSANLVADIAALEKSVPPVASLNVGTDRSDGSRSDITACWSRTSLTCAYKPTSKCSKTSCDCCPCACSALLCFFNDYKSGYTKVSGAIKGLTAADRRSVAPEMCKLAKKNIYKNLISLYKEARCPGYTSYIKSMNGWQANFNKWCKGFSG